jgi:hypothetical protein
MRSLVVHLVWVPGPAEVGLAVAAQRPFSEAHMLMNVPAGRPSHIDN